MKRERKRGWVGVIREQCGDSRPDTVHKTHVKKGEKKCNQSMERLNK